MSWLARYHIQMGKNVTTDELEKHALALEESGRYRVLRRIPELPERKNFKRDGGEKLAVILDTETTGLDWAQEEIIELGAIAISYNKFGEIVEIVDWFSKLREPAVSVSEETTQITGLTFEALKGKHITEAEIEGFFGPADLIIAHNAGFDRPFCEALSPVFKNKPWACSATEIDWKTLGFDGAKLSYLATISGWFYDAHRALDDCKALLQVLMGRPPRSNETPFRLLLSSAREARTRISFSAPFSARSELRAHGFRWKPASDLQPGEWYIEVADDELERVQLFLGGKKFVRLENVKSQRIDAFHRYRN